MTRNEDKQPMITQANRSSSPMPYDQTEAEWVSLHSTVSEEKYLTNNNQQLED